MAVYLKHPKIKGYATHQDYKDWITVNSVKWEVGRVIQNSVGRAGNREASEPWAGDFMIHRTVDGSSPSILEHATGAQQACDIEVACVASGKNEYVRLKLSGALLSYHTIGLLGEGDDEERLQIVYTKMEFKYIPRDKDNNATSPIVGTFDLEKGAVKS
jgi:type VI secretion system secreted protein Hcp